MPLLRYSGIRQYQRLRPFFLGMVFGEFSMAIGVDAYQLGSKCPRTVLSVALTVLF